MSIHVEAEQAMRARIIPMVDISPHETWSCPGVGSTAAKGEHDPQSEKCFHLSASIFGHRVLNAATAAALSSPHDGNTGNL
jgi:hypothetical protein